SGKALRKNAAQPRNARAPGRARRTPPSFRPGRGEGRGQGLKPLRIATRGSALALWQAKHLRGAPAEMPNGSEISNLEKAGDRFAGAAVEQIGIRGIFTKELEDALIDGRADIAVHSMKDVPTEFSTECLVSTIFPREDPRDALVSRNGEMLKNLPHGARIG